VDYYETEFVNKRKEQVTVMENGRVLLTLQPGESKFIESFDPKTSYSPWYRLTFKDEGVVKLEENRAWKFPYPGQLRLTAINEDGVICEGLRIDQTLYDCYLQIPRYIPVDYRSPWAFFEKVRYVQQEEKVKDGDYFRTVKKLEWIKERRNRKEIKDIEKRLVEEAIERAKAETEKGFLKLDEAGE
jgi:hypothetical protein